MTGDAFSAELRNPIYARCLVFHIFTGGRPRTRVYRGHSAGRIRRLFSSGTKKSEGGKA